MLINFFPLEFQSDEYALYAVDYSEKYFKELRYKYNSTHSFLRIGSKIYISNKSGNDLDIGELQKLKIFEDHKITSALIKHLFFRTNKERYPSLVPLQFYPYKILSTKNENNLIYNLLPDELKSILKYLKIISVEIRLLKIDNKKRFGLLIDNNWQWHFDIDCFKLHNEGFQLNGKEVIHSEPFPGLEGILAPDSSFIGIIKMIENSKAHVLTNEGIKIYSLEELFLRKTKKNMHSYLVYKLKEKKADYIFDQLKKSKGIVYSGKKQYEDILKIASTFCINNNSPVIYSNKDGFSFIINDTGFSFSNTYDIKNPTFLFDPSGIRTENIYPDKGLTTHGPFDSSINSEIKKTNILSICNKNNRGKFTSFLHDLINGLPNSKYFTKGFKRKYDLHQVDYSIKEINDQSINEYTKAITDLDPKPNIALIELSDEFKKTEATDSPYCILKAKLMNLGIPVQIINTKKLLNYDEYILNSISLQMYAKLGGVPWVIKANNSVDRELVVGIGHRINRSNTYAGNTEERIVGITTFFSADGQYLMGSKIKEVLYDEYFKELLNSLRTSIRMLSAEYFWNKGDTVRLIFHIFKPLKNIELDVVCSLIKEFVDYKIQFSFITISKKQSFHLFDPDEKGFNKFSQSEKRGAFVPKRRTNIKIDDNSCLIQMIGPEEMKTNIHGISNPLLITIRIPEDKNIYADIKPYLFTDLYYVVQQIFNFTSLTWRSFLPFEKPASMLYSELIANLLGKLRKINYWNPEIVNTSLKYKKWFL
jgi:hypothetical protein